MATFKYDTYMMTFGLALFVSEAQTAALYSLADQKPSLGP